jgi:molybdenum cofactor cytidylyltransferase
MPNVAALILAAGESSRFGQPKQLAQFGGKTLLRRIVDEAKTADCAPVLVVTGSGKEKVAAELSRVDARVVENANWQSGIGSSIHTGMRALELEQNVDAVVLLVCDQPQVDREVIRALVALWKRSGKEIIASSYSDTLGVPALFDRSIFAELLALEGDNGAKKVILANCERVAEFPFPDGRIDIDTWEDYKRIAAGTLRNKATCSEERTDR